MAAKKIFGEWLKIRRLAAEMTALDLATAIGVDPTVYRDLEAGSGGLTESQIVRLVKLERMRITRRDVDFAGPVVLPEDGSEGLEPVAAGPAKPMSSLDSLIASVQAKNDRTAARQAKPVSPLGAFLADELIARQLTRVTLAKLCKLGPTDLDDIDAGFVPGAAGLRAMAEGLGLSVETLIHHAEK